MTTSARDFGYERREPGGAAVYLPTLEELALAHKLVAQLAWEAFVQAPALRATGRRIMSNIDTAKGRR